jgi:uncharacterized membrane protein
MYFNILYVFRMFCLGFGGFVKFISDFKFASRILSHLKIFGGFFMSFHTKWFLLFLSLMFGMLSLESHNACIANSVTLYTPYTKISVPPGESIDYTIDVINNSKEVQNVLISVIGMPKGWNFDLKSGGWVISQISILPGERKNLSLRVDVPLQVNKGNYCFKVVAGGFCTLPLVVNVSKQGTYKTEFTTDQPNMQGQAKSAFTFNANLKNRTADKQLYALMANTPQGWEATFKVNFKQVTSVEIEPNNTANITIELKPSENMEAGTYEVPVRAATNSTSAELNLQAVITGNYNMELTTPSGLLSTDITAGDSKRVELVVKNTGSSILSGLDLTFSAPVNWDVTFEPRKIDKLLPGKVAQVFATIKADKKAIPGDYVTNIVAKTSEVNSSASFRISVKTSMVWGWFGILIIIIGLGGVYYLFRKYGRR